LTDQIDWCVIYVKGVENADALAEVVAASIGGVVDGPFITTPGGVELDATTNALNPKFEAEPPDETDFTWWPYRLELDVSEREGVPLVSAILRGLWDSDTPPSRRAPLSIACRARVATETGG